MEKKEDNEGVRKKEEEGRGQEGRGGRGKEGEGGKMRGTVWSLGCNWREREGKSRREGEGWKVWRKKLEV